MNATPKIVLALLWTGTVLAGDLEAGKSPPAANGDLLVLSSGEKFSGTFLEPTVALRTAYGRLNLDKCAIRTLSPGEGFPGLVRIWTANSNLITGFPETAAFEFEGPERRRFRWGEVARLALDPKSGPAPSAERFQVELSNGDRLTGDVLSHELSLANGNARESFPVSELTTLSFNVSTTAVAVAHLSGGRTVQGILIPAGLPFRLTVGPELELYPEQLRTVTRFGSPAAANPGAPKLEGMGWVPPGDFLMGSPGDEPGRDPDEGPQTKVVFTRGFWMGKCEVTQAEFQGLMGINPSNVADNPARPVEKVTWFEAMEYCEKLNRRAEGAGRLPQGYSYRLPTEAEWEYACRAGSTTRFSYGDDKADAHLADYAWYTRNGDSTTHPVGLKLPNAWGFYDMHGNVWEWCLDRWEGTLPGGTITNSPAMAKGNLRTARGGSWLYDGKACRCANRDDYSPWNRCGDVGFRVVLGSEKE